MEDKSLGAILLESTNLSEEQLAEALAVHKEKGMRLGDALIQLKFLKMEDILKALSIQLGMQYTPRLTPEEIATELLVNIPINYAKKHEVIPLKRDAGRVLVALSDPTNHFVLDDLRLLFGSQITPIIASSYEILNAINTVYNKMSDVGSTTAVDQLEGENLASIEQELEEVQDLLESADEAPIIRLVNSLLFRAVKQKASDIHIEPFEKELVVRFRVDGVLYDIMHPPKKAQAAIISRVKVMGSLNIAEKRLPQDGRIRIKIAGKDIDIRLSTVPTSFGESVVMRLLDKSQLLLDLPGIGIVGGNLDHLNKMIQKSHGILLVTGPTGSGKTTTLYACLSKINSVDKKIITVEDPVEYQLTGVNQIQINPKIELTFASGLRSILRQDPDVILVGEIRDHETAEIAIQASLTGHLVFSTLHTNDAPSSITRLVDMGIEPFLVASSLLGILAQRLIRTVCKKCGRKYTPTEEELVEIGLAPADLAGRQIFRAVGCPACVSSGYAGRTGIHEFLLVEDDVRQHIVKSNDTTSLRKLAMSKGMKTLRDDGAAKVLKGVTTIEEVLRVTQEETARI